MATPLIPAAPPTALRIPVAHAAHRGGLTGALHRRAGRIEVFVVAMVLLLPQLLTVLLGGD